MAKKDDIYYFPVRISHELDRLFDEIIHRPWGLPRELRPWNPSVDFLETPEAFVLEADLPGVKGEDVKVDLEGNDLILQGRRLQEKTQENGRFFCQERCFGKFVRRMPLPRSVDKEKISARFHDGVLTVTIPKIKEAKEKGKEP